MVKCSPALSNYDIIKLIRFVSSLRWGHEMSSVIDPHLILLISVCSFDVTRSCSFGRWIVSICFERKVLLPGSWWLICYERKILLAGV
jgi:hypothetical protein